MLSVNLISFPFDSFHVAFVSERNKWNTKYHVHLNTNTTITIYIYIYISIYVFVWRKHLKIQLESPNFVAFLLLNFWARVLWIVVVFSWKIKTQNTRLRLFDVCIFPFFISCTNKNNIIETKIENTYNKNKNQNKNSQLARSMIVSTRFIISFQNFPFNFLFQSLQLTT